MARRFLPPALILLWVAILIAAPSVVAGQGNGRPKAPKSNNGNGNGHEQAPAQSPSPSSSGTPATVSAPPPAPPVNATPPGTPAASSPIAPAASPTVPESQPEVPAAVNTFRQFGSWLDDASAPARGEGYTGIAIGHWRMAEMSQTNVPMLSAGLAVSDRVQVSASVPFYRTSFQGATFHGLDDVYLGARVNLVDPTLTLSEFGLSIGSVVEVLSPGIEGGRVHFAFPVSMELRRAPFRAYGSAGYFTRGSLFSGGAVEWTAPSRFVLTGALTQSYSTGIDETLDLLAVGRQRLDVMASAAYPVGTRGAAYVNLGRSLSSVLEGGTRIAISGGFSFRFSAIPSRP